MARDQPETQPGRQPAPRLAWIGVRGRLLLAFFGISAFALVAALAAMYSFTEVGRVLGRMTQERVPAALASLELSRQAERIVVAAPSLLAVRSADQHAEISAVIEAEVDGLEALLDDLRETAVNTGALATMEPAVDGMRRNLAALDGLVAQVLEARRRMAALLQELAAANVATQRLIAPGVLVMDSKLAEWRHANADPATDEPVGGGANAQLGREIVTFVPHQKAQIELSAINDGLLKVAAAETLTDLPLLGFPLRRSLYSLEALASEFDAKLGPRLLERVETFRGLMEGEGSILGARQEELELIGYGQGLLAENTILSGDLTAAVDRLVGAAKEDIASADGDAAAVQRLSSSVLIAVVILSLLSSALIVWLYVGRNLIARLTALSGSMLAVAGGNLRVPLPPADGGDEIAEMTRALTVFRDTAVEIEDKGLREIDSARQRLVDAIESISEGFAFYDVEDRLALSNARYNELLYGDTGIEIEPGMAFETVVRRAVELGLIREAGDDPERYVEERLAMHRDPGPPTLQERADGRWVLIAERRIAGGGTVAVYSDITLLKRREIELEEANRRTKEAADEIARRHRELEALSAKLAKYLSPQVYASIFAGRQQVELASQRKKLTVFFSDIEGFTETTDVMESEDLTRLLNEYLTEMSRVALDHGGTIDKYVGDAIMIFFGDPESQGVREDALACVKMAIAMQKRIRELSAAWRDAGIERPLACRIGIHTGYCTVGNFGSADRMDYTIIGGAVNLASRLEHEAPAGGILISYETHAHVKHEVSCEAMAPVQVRGIGHPVATFRVVDLHENLADGREALRAELPNLEFAANVGLMSAAERRQAANVLQEALARLAAADDPEPGHRFPGGV